ncbi:hypothetical protein M6B38_123140 [Iris pallida]|uniref:Uncharacterized protein n=1 Tax=Iris pallida TaxID=29817 RepID=A0AAX6H2B4_IRIPA|nr:hypothetical protein M6B38_123140 [Iris pallida]
MPQSPDRTTTFFFCSNKVPTNIIVTSLQTLDLYSNIIYGQPNIVFAVPLTTTNIMWWFFFTGNLTSPYVDIIHIFRGIESGFMFLFDLVFGCIRVF